MSDEAALADLVEHYLALRREGKAPAPQTFAAEHPEFAELSRLLMLATEMEGLTRPSTSAPLPDLSGTDFRLIRRIARGGMGEIFEAEQRSLGRRVAVKVLAPTYLQDPEARQRFENEARLIARLRHPNIIEVYGAGSTPSCLYYAMALIDGEDLPHHPPKDLRVIAKIGLQIAHALAYAHANGILHRDVKPANLLLDAEGNVHIGDFGIAAALRIGPSLSDPTETQLGTLRYMAPERLARGISDFATDQYALGITLRELIEGVPPLPERDPEAFAKRICEAPLPPVRCADPDLAAVIDKATAFRPEDRYPDLAALAEDLRRFLSHEPVSARRAPLHALRLWMRRRPAVALSLVVAMLCVAAAVVALWVWYGASARAERSAVLADEAQEAAALAEEQAQAARDRAVHDRAVARRALSRADQRRRPDRQESTERQRRPFPSRRTPMRDTERLE